jgi:hypothetical protein
VLALHTAHALGARELSGKFLWGVDEGGQTLRANEYLLSGELQREERNLSFRSVAAEALFRIFRHFDSPC